MVDAGRLQGIAPSSTHLVLIPSYNPGVKLEDTLRAARAQWAPVWVVVDGSTDGSADWLRARGAHVEAQAIAERADAAGGALLTRAEAFDADLLVMGAYGRGRLMEAFGGVTKRMLTNSKLPLILGH